MKNDMNDIVQHQQDTPQTVKAWPLSEFAGLPCFAKPIVNDGNLVVALDGWVIEPTGDWGLDHVTGERYADAAIRYARTKGNPDFVTFVLATIHLKGHAGKAASGIEAGFLARLAKLACAGALN